MNKTTQFPKTYKYAEAYLTMRCNLKCSYCLNTFDKNFSRVKVEELDGKKWIDSLNKIEFPSNIPITLGGGEPSLHKDFIFIINNLRKETHIDILTNMMWGKEKIKKFINEVNPERLRRDAPYASIRVSYHPEQMDINKVVENAKMLQDAGFYVGIWAVLFPSPDQLSKINMAQFICRNKGIDFRLKEFVGEYNGVTYGTYKYLDSTSYKFQKKAECKTTELLIGPRGDVYKCHRDLYAYENSLGNISDLNFEIKDTFKNCPKFGECHPCDVKVKTDSKQNLGHTSVEIKVID